MKISVLTVLLVLLPASLVAHSIKLKSGRTVYGTIVAQSRSTITLRVRGRNRTFAKSAIREISYRTVRPRRRVRRRVRPRVRRPQPRRARPVAKKGRAVAVHVPTRRAPRIKINKWAVSARSALLPGWGHLSLAEYRPAVLYGAAFLAAFGYSAQLRGATLARENSYRNDTVAGFLAVEGVRSTAGLPGGQAGSLVLNYLWSQLASRSYATSLNQYNNSLNLLALVYAGQLVHAYYSGSLRHGQYRRGTPTGVTATAGRPGMTFALERNSGGGRRVQAALTIHF